MPGRRALARDPARPQFACSPADASPVALKKRHRAVRWFWLSIGLIRALVAGVVPAAEARQLVAIQASASAEAHIEESSRPECAPPHHDGCALCANAFACAEPALATGAHPTRGSASSYPGGAVRLEARPLVPQPRPRSPPVA